MRRELALTALTFSVFLQGCSLFQKPHIIHVDENLVVSPTINAGQVVEWRDIDRSAHEFTIHFDGKSNPCEGGNPRSHDVSGYQVASCKLRKDSAGTLFTYHIDNGNNLAPVPQYLSVSRTHPCWPC